MTAASLAKARARKREIEAEIFREQAIAIKEFRAWLIRERKAYQERQRYIDTDGRDSVAFLVSDMVWRELWLEKPETPPDHVWRKLRGEPEPEDDRDTDQG